MCIFSPHHQTWLSVHARSVKTVQFSTRTLANASSRCNANALAYSGSHPRKQVLRKVFQKTCGNLTKWWISCRRRAQRKRHASAAALKDARSALQKSRRFSSYLILRRMSHGAICSINTPAVINTVLRQPMAWKRMGGGGGGGGGVEWERLQLWLSSLPYFSCHFVPVITPKMVAGL